MLTLPCRSVLACWTALSPRSPACPWPIIVVRWHRWASCAWPSTWAIQYWRRGRALTARAVTGTGHGIGAAHRRAGTLHLLRRRGRGGRCSQQGCLGPGLPGHRSGARRPHRLQRPLCGDRRHLPGARGQPCAAVATWTAMACASRSVGAATCSQPRTAPRHDRAGRDVGRCHHPVRSAAPGCRRRAPAAGRLGAGASRPPRAGRPFHRDPAGGRGAGLRPADALQALFEEVEAIKAGSLLAKPSPVPGRRLRWYGDRGTHAVEHGSTL